MKRTLVALIIATTGVTTAAQAAVPNHDGDANTRVIVLRPCKYEDSNNCYWDASVAGNGRGHSFDAIAINNRTTCIRYWDHQYNKHHGYCTHNAYPSR